MVKIWQIDLKALCINLSHNSKINTPVSTLVTTFRSCNHDRVWSVAVMTVRWPCDPGPDQRLLRVCAATTLQRFSLWAAGHMRTAPSGYYDPCLPPPEGLPDIHLAFLWILPVVSSLNLSQRSLPDWTAVGCSDGKYSTLRISVGLGFSWQVPLPSTDPS